MLIPLGFLSQGLAENYWIALLDSTSTSTATDIQTDAENNIYVCGTDGSVNQGYVAKIDPQGVIVWQRRVATNNLFRLGVSSTGDVYAATGFNSTGEFRAHLFKYNSSGVLQWQRRFGTSNSQSLQGLAVDTNGDVYISGHSNDSSQPGIFTAKYNSAGTLQFQRRASVSTATGSRIATDGSNNVYVSGKPPTNQQNYLVIKYNSSGTIQYQRQSGAAGNDQPEGIAVNSAGDSHVAVQSTQSGALGLHLLKIDTSGTLVWGRQLGNLSTTRPRAVALDANDNAYVAGFTEDGNQSALFAKYDSSGTIQLQRIVSSSASALTLQIRGASIDADGNILLCGVSDSPSRTFIMKLPNDGSLTGVYSLDGQEFDYKASSLTTATSVFGANNIPESAATSSFTADTPNISEAAASRSTLVLTI